MRNLFLCAVVVDLAPALNVQLRPDNISADDGFQIPAHILQTFNALTDTSVPGSHGHFIAQRFSALLDSSFPINR